MVNKNLQIQLIVFFRLLMRRAERFTDPRSPLRHTKLPLLLRYLLPVGDLHLYPVEGRYFRDERKNGPHHSQCYNGQHRGWEVVLHYIQRPWQSLRYTIQSVAERPHGQGWDVDTDILDL